MALRKDGNSRNNVSHKPYDANNSFVKKMANQVTRLMGWHSESQSVVSQNYDSLSNAVDEDSVAPTAKRIRVDSDDTFCLPSTSRALNEACSPIQPINDLKTLGVTNRNRCIISSTPATILVGDNKTFIGIGRSNSVIPPTRPSIFSSTSIQPSTEHQLHSSNIADSFENTESVNSSLTIPQFKLHQRHNVTVPAISRDVPSQVSHLDKSKLSGSFSSTNSRAPSFNVDVFSSSSRRLSMSVCESRNSSSLSPFYSARTMYGGASALLPYGKQNVGRMRSASTSRVNLFAPRSNITIQPVPSLTKTNDQETMSAAARRILDTLEKYCSPVTDAKKIPVNESSRKADDATLSLQPLAKGVKRKLPALSQMTPSTTDLLRIKRKEQMQDSVSNARHVVSTVPESSIVAEDSDSSDSVDLDYSVLKETTKTPNSQKYVSKIRRKQEAKFDDSPVPPVKLPNAVLKITNLPKFDITDMFTFSKPLLLENLEQNVTEASTSTVAEGVQKSDSSSQTVKPALPKVSAPALATSNTATVSGQSPKLPAATVELESNKGKQVSSKKQTPTFLTNNLTFSKSSSAKTASWTCRTCCLESTEERCSSCTSKREQNTKPVPAPKLPQKDPPPVATPPVVAVSGWGDKFKPASDTWLCNECFVRSPNTESKCVSCASPKPGTSAPSLPPLPNTNELWKNLQKSAAGSWKCDSCWVQNKPSESKCASCGEPKEPGKSNAAADKVDASTPKFLFGIDKAGATAPSIAGSVKFGVVDKLPANITFGCNNVAATTTTSSATPPKPTVSFGFGTPALSAVSSSNDSASTISTTTFTFGNGSPKNVLPVPPVQFAFGLNKVAAPEPAAASLTPPSNALGLKNPLIDGVAVTKNNEAEKPVQNKTDAPVFNDVSSSTNNTRNPLLQKTTMATSETTTFNDTSIFKRPKASVLKTVPANKENGEDTNAGNLFNNISSSTSESSSAKNPIMFPAFGAAGGSNMFGSNGFAKADNKAAPIAGNNTTMVSSSVSNVFSNSFSTPAAPKLTNDTQTSMFVTKAKMEAPPPTVNDDKSSKIFGNTNCFAVSSSQPAANTTPSVFGAFNADSFGGAKKADATTGPGVPFNSTSTFSFGTSNISATGTPPAPAQQPISGGFAFNGPTTKGAEGNAPKFVFGSSLNANSNTNSFGSSAPPPAFPFNSQSAPDASAAEQSRPAVNSMFSASPLKIPQPEIQQPNNNSTPAFGNSMFGNFQQQQQQAQQQHAVKRTGGFNFAVPNQVVAPQHPINSFNNFTNSTNENQNQSGLNANANATPAYTSPFVFGGMNSQSTQPHNFTTTLPSTFNFTSGNALTSFTAQPTTNNNPAPGGGRKIRKAVRRTAK